ncbi:MAG: hypothetical protein GY797_06305 [Deltaproteobacteria bacterium]|nr:hypothetical protein [Deltaproteobacteria bacterium]
MLFKVIEDFVVLPPGTEEIVVKAIIWSKEKIVLGVDAKEVEVQFEAPMLIAPPSGVETVQSQLIGGTVLKDKDEWLSREFTSVSIAGRINLK